MRKLKLEELARVSTEEYKRKNKTPLIVVLDNIRSALNVGSIFRTCDAFAIEKMILTGITSQPPHKEISKTAIGATHSVLWEYHEDVFDATLQLKNEGYQLLAVEQTTHSNSLYDFKSDAEKIALVLGNEVNGVSDEVLTIVDGAIEIPQFGTKHSLNVSVCAGIVIWDLFKLLTNKQ